jgi:hypothetical protein
MVIPDWRHLAQGRQDLSEDKAGRQKARTTMTLSNAILSRRVLPGSIGIGNDGAENILRWEVLTRRLGFGYASLGRWNLILQETPPPRPRFSSDKLKC